MKKITFLSILILVFVCTSFSQNEKNFSIGIHVSPSIAWLKPETKMHETKGIRLGFGYGLITEIALADNYSLATGLESVYSGGKLQWVNTIGDTITTATYRVQYLEFPLGIKMKTNEINYITYFAKFGGGLNFRLRSFADYSYRDQQGNSLPSLLDKDINKEINLFRISFLIGLGIEYSLGGTTRALIGVNFNNGLTDIFKDNDITAQNNFITVNLGIIF